VSKRKMMRFKLKTGETLIKQGSMDYAPTGGFSHSIMGQAHLTNTRFCFHSIEQSKVYLAFEIPLSDITEIGKTGIPVLTRSILIKADEKSYRFNVFPMGGWLKKLREAKEACGNDN